MRSTLLLISVMAIGACSTDLNPGAERVRQISPGMTHSCEFLGPITASEGMGIDVAADVQSTFNKIRNEVAQRGGNAFVVTTSSTSQSMTVAQADSYRCP